MPAAAEPPCMVLKQHAKAQFAAVFSKAMTYILSEIVVNVVVNALSTAGITATKTRPVAAAIRPYSIAVAPDSSFMKRTNLLISYSP